MKKFCRLKLKSLILILTSICLIIFIGITHLHNDVSGNFLIIKLFEYVALGYNDLIQNIETGSFMLKLCYYS